MPAVNPSPFRKSLKGAGAGGGASEHKFGCLMLRVPPALAFRLASWAARAVNPDHLFGDGLKSPWDMHVTLKYGFPAGSVTPAELSEALHGCGPFQARILKCSQFPDRGDGAVLKLDVDSPKLHRAYHRISKRFKATDKFYPDYKPHVTLAYLKPEVAKQYENLNCPFCLHPLDLCEAIFSTPEGKKSTFGVSGVKAMSWIAGNGSDLVKPPEYMGPRRARNPVVRRASLKVLMKSSRR